MRLQPSWSLDDAQSLRDAAAREALDRIRRERDRVHPKLRPLLAYLERHLFDPQLNVNQLKRACEIRDNSIAILFHSQVGTSPKVFISERRLETAARLLSDSDLRVWQVGELVGYSGPGVFSKAFRRWAGLRPQSFRARARKLQAAEEPPADDSFSDEDLRQALAGTLPLRRARVLLRRLSEIYEIQLSRR